MTRPGRKAGSVARPAAAQDEATGLGFLALLRQLERNAAQLPRIGRNERLRDTVVRLGQDPFLAFPDMDLARVDLATRPPVVRAQFLGFFGPFGALPLNWTGEVVGWMSRGDDAFVAFADIFTARFQELFFRAWSDARAITQFDHAGDDRFRTYLLSVVGTGTPAYRNRDALDGAAKLRLVPLAQGRVKSAVRLRQMLQLHFGGRVGVRIEEMIPTWLEFEPDGLSRLGRNGSSLGVNMHLGSRSRSLGDRIRIHLSVRTLTAFRRLLPGGTDHAQLRDIVARFSRWMCHCGCRAARCRARFWVKAHCWAGWPAWPRNRAPPRKPSAQRIFA